MAPFALGENRIQHGFLIVLLEFFVIHSSAFMGFVGMSTTMPRVKKILAILGLGVLYSTFQRLVAPRELVAQRAHDGLTVRGLLAPLVFVEADDVAPILDRDLA